ncbi:rac GTPase-activating protein 1 [Sabethes cyaneus]|uniref:rac GTPase-activating protein 1 n=1 Tax=Sabethes cyaneus TaxID=53552 RepID=UPI00237ED2F9|nr:rac GTPase-activating protein 1 [Sabethes cyaneus]
MELSIIAQHDDLRRCSDILRDGKAELEFLKFVQHQDDCRLRWLKLSQDAQRLQRELDTALRQMSDLDTKLFFARKLLEEETRARKRAEHEREEMEKKINAVHELIRNEYHIKDETKQQLASINLLSNKRKSINVRHGERLGNEINSTGSFLSDLSLTQSEDDFININASSELWKPFRPSEPKKLNNKRAKLSTDKTQTSNIKETKKVIEIGPNENIVAHTKVSVPQDDGPILAESIIHAMPPQQQPSNSKSTPAKSSTAKENISPNLFKTPTKADSKYYKGNMYTPSAPPIEEVEPSIHEGNIVTPTVKARLIKQHVFAPKTFLKYSESCTCCQQRIRFGSVGLRCRECKAVLHSDCQERLTIACVPQSAGTPTVKGQQAGCLSDYTPNVGPMIPGLIVHCVNEIETRGLSEVGIYRISGAEREIRSLKEKFLRGKTVPNLSSIDIHVLCGCIKDFLRSLREPLIPQALWLDFSNAVQTISSKQKQKELFDLIARMPQPNRDTLAYLIQHFQRVAECKEIKMPLDNLAKVFAPTIVGFTSPKLDPQIVFAETVVQCNIMSSLLNIQTDYWSQFVDLKGPTDDEKLQKEYELTKPFVVRNTPKGGRKERKFYATPPYPKKLN